VASSTMARASWLRSLGFDFLLDRLGVMMPLCHSIKQIASPSIAPVMYDIVINSAVIQRIACRTWGGVPMNHEWHEAMISLKNRFHELKTEMDLVHQAWPTAIRERDFDRQSSLIAHERGLILEVLGVINTFQQLVSQELMHTKALRRLESPPASRIA
jgi:hypothetical protein